MLQKKPLLLIIDVQKGFFAPYDMAREIQHLSNKVPAIHAIFEHNESITPFKKFIQWRGPVEAESLLEIDDTVIHNGYTMPPELLDKIKAYNPSEVFIVGTDPMVCIPAFGWALFDAGIKCSLISYLIFCMAENEEVRQQIVDTGISLWKRTIGDVITTPKQLKKHL